MLGSYLSLFTWVGLSVALIQCVSSERGYSDVDALYALKKSLQDPDNALASWDPNNVDPCTWSHVTCDTDNKVIRVDLGNYKLSGNLVPDLANLDHLQNLELFMNNIQGTIPPELGNLKNLISLDLYYNNISGSIPAKLGNIQTLKFLRLNDNQLTGCVPEEIIKIPSLGILNISSNNLCGPKPSSGVFEHIPIVNYKNNPRLEDPSSTCDCNRS